MNANTAALEERIADLEEQIADTPARRAARKAEAAEQAYLARLDRALNRIRRDIKGLAAHVRSRLKAETEGAERHLDLLRKEGRKHQHQQATEALAQLPPTIAAEIVTARFPEPGVYHDIRASIAEVEATRRQRQHLEQYRQDHIDQAVSELLEAVEAT
jgi:ketosteroid isomerase-like protein